MSKLSPRLDAVLGRLSKVTAPERVRAVVLEAKEKIDDPDHYREEHGRCPVGFHWDGEHCVPVGEGGGDKRGGKDDEEGGDKRRKGDEGESHKTLDPRTDSNNDGVADGARVGVPGSEVPPPPKIQRLPNLTDEERRMESAFADAFESDPDNVADLYLRDVLQKAVSGGPATFVTDDAKLLTPDYNPKDATPEDVGAARARRNYLFHQAANAIAKKAFLKHLEVLAQLPNDHPKKSVLVTSGGTGAGKGFAIKSVGEVKAIKDNVGGIWDAAGEQNATENPWILEECKKRGIKATFLFVDADPLRQWSHPKVGVVSRAAQPPPAGEGRMVDAQLFADSYALGAKNFKAFHDKYQGDADFIFLNTWKTDDKGFPIIERADGIDRRSLDLDPDDLYAKAAKVIQEKAPTEAIKEGATIGHRIWGPPKRSEKSSASAERVIMAAAKKSKGKSKKDELEEEMLHNYEENVRNLDRFYKEKADDDAAFDQLEYDENGKLKLPKKGKGRGKKDDDKKMKAAAERIDDVAEVVSLMGLRPEVVALVEEAAEALNAVVHYSPRRDPKEEDALWAWFADQAEPDEPRPYRADPEEEARFQEWLAQLSTSARRRYHREGLQILHDREVMNDADMRASAEAIDDQQALNAFYTIEVNAYGGAEPFEVWVESQTPERLAAAIETGRKFLEPKALTAASDENLRRFYRLTVGHPEGYDEWVSALSNEDRKMIQEKMSHGL